MGFNDKGPTTAELARRPPKAKWATKAGFETIFDAESAGCYEGNAWRYMGGKRVNDDPAPPPEDVDPFLKWPDGRINGMFDSKPPEIEWFADNALIAGRAHALVGVGGTGKTRLQYHLALGAVLGRLPWKWQIKRTGSAALFLTEDVTAEVHRTIHRLGASLSEDERKTLTRQMRVFPLAGRSARMLSLIDGGALVENEVYDWVMGQVECLPKPVAFLGFDPALALTEGDELNQAHQRRLGEVIDRFAIETGASAVLTAHAAKGLMHAEELGSHAARGGGALTDAVRGEFVVRNMTADEARKFGIEDRAERQLYVQLAATKGNHLPPEAYVPVWLKRGAGGTLSQVSLEQVERGTVGQRELQALELLRKTAPLGDTTMRFWRTDCVAHGVISASASESAQEKGMERIRDALRDAGMVGPGRSRGTWIPT
jgi:hypothetical protein